LKRKLIAVSKAKNEDKERNLGILNTILEMGPIKSFTSFSNKCYLSSLIEQDLEILVCPKQLGQSTARTVKVV